MSKIGYYRYKTSVAKGDTSVDLYINSILASTKIVRSQDYCIGDRLLKYLDQDSKYRYFTFNKFYEINDNPRKIGETNKFITSILTDQSSKASIGNSNERTLSLTADVTEEQLRYLESIWTSARVYLYIGDFTTDTAKDWVEVTIQGDNTVKRRKVKAGLINIDVKLPEWYTIRAV